MESFIGGLSFLKDKYQTIAIIENLSQGKVNNSYIIKEVRSNDEDMKKFLFSLGCYEGERVTLISILGDNYVIKIKDGRYSIDKQLAMALIVDNV